MKISKSKLRQIIKEELAEVNRFPPDMIGRAAHSAAQAGDLPAWEGEPFGEYDLEAENERGAIAAVAKELGTDPEDPSLWEKILDAVRRANVFPRTEQ
jgi:hypothetical protein